jgi:uncharacterized membrane protein
MIESIKKILSKDDLQAISAAIAQAESSTSGEIRVSVRERRSRKEKDISVEQLARREFESLGMAKTRDRTGVLLYFLIEARQFSIFADEGIHAKVQDGTWQRIADSMSEHFSRQNFRQGIIQGIQAIGKILSDHFPRKSDDTNELPNQVRVTWEPS